MTPALVTVAWGSGSDSTSTIFASEIFTLASALGSMDPNLERLRKSWKLTDDEEEGVTLPSGLWQANSDSHKLCLVGRLLSNRPYKFEALASSIRSMILPVKGMETKQLEEGRILLQFNHIIDKQRAMEGCPWSFEKNVLILNSIGDRENPMTVSLEMCNFFVNVHDLPMSMMTLGVATLIGNRLGSFWDLEVDDSGCSWGASLRIRVGLNVNQPLKRH
ncbi:UNVERIFIED_CONTAM: hypothetical protein Slati_2740600 [Sesamum latifolium]|uniref:DUF4283 domain-containing protein n=1 Tax=Sesamum latifolium TaxID=2727402 RepID=A0AAW2VYD4_9LAMI